MNNDDRQELFKIYSRMTNDLNRLKEIIQSYSKDKSVDGVEQAKSYWLGNIDIGLNANHYFSYNPNFKKFLEDNKIITENEEFIEDEEAWEDDEKRPRLFIYNPNCL